MKIAVIGLGFVGLVTATVLANRGHTIKCVDTDKTKIDKLRMGGLYIYEPGLDDLFQKNRTNMSFYTDYAHLKDNEIAFICVPTPTVHEKIDLNYVRDAVSSVYSADREAIIAIKSTVVPGTASSFSSLVGADVVSNPEFLREGYAINDTIHPERIIVGGKNSEYVDKVAKVWEFSGAPVLKTTNENAELIKYASNAFLAMKISFINEFANLCERIPGTDVDVVSQGMGLDHRIGTEFLRAGLGFGGSCLPKDTRALVSYAEEKGVDLMIVKNIIDVNNERIGHAVELIEDDIGDLKGKDICVLGLSFKENTNDIRESKALELIYALKSKGARVRAYDPVVRQLEGIEITGEIEECNVCDCIVIASEWKEFESATLYNHMAKVIDLRRVVDRKLNPKVRAIGAYHAKD